MAVACKRPRSFCQKCWWQVTLKCAYTLDLMKSEWDDYAAVQAWHGNLSGNELTRNFSGNIQPQSSQLAEPLWTNPGLKSGISACEVIFTLKKTKQCRWVMNGWTFSQNLCKQGKTHHHSECRDHLFMVQLLQLSSSCHKHLSVRGSDSPFSQLQWFWSQSGVRRWFSSNPTVACVVRARQLSLSFTHSFAAFGEFPHGQCYFVVVVIGFFLACNDSGRMFDKSFPVSTFFCCCFFFFSGDYLAHINSTL